jgi:hypothetical protein
MWKVREPFWNAASLVCDGAPVKKSSRTYDSQRMALIAPIVIGCIDYCFFRKFLPEKL